MGVSSPLFLYHNSSLQQSQPHHEATQFHSLPKYSMSILYYDDVLSVPAMPVQPLKHFSNHCSLEGQEISHCHRDKAAEVLQETQGGTTAEHPGRGQSTLHPKGHGQCPPGPVPFHQV
eukprot:Em0001g3553a